jgi:hypothetical protein
LIISQTIKGFPAELLLTTSRPIPVNGAVSNEQLNDVRQHTDVTLDINETVALKKLETTKLVENKAKCLQRRHDGTQKRNIKNEEHPKMHLSALNS